MVREKKLVGRQEGLRIQKTKNVQGKDHLSRSG